MNPIVRRVLAGCALTAAIAVAVAVPANAATDSTPTGAVTVVGDPGSGTPGDPWQFDPIGIPVFGLIQSVLEAPGKLLPSI